MEKVGVEKFQDEVWPGGWEEVEGLSPRWRPENTGRPQDGHREPRWGKNVLTCVVREDIVKELAWGQFL